MTHATISGVTHHRVALNGTNLHYVSAGSAGSPILLVHGWPETWWAFHKVIPVLAKFHRVFAVDLRGFGASDVAQVGNTSATMAEDLHALVGHVGLGPVHLAAQDFSGPLAYRLAATHPQDLLSFIAVETGLPGFGLEILTNPMIAWYFGTLAKPGAAERFFKGRETELLSEFIFTPPMTTSTAIGADDITEFIRGYDRAGGWNGAQAIYSSNLYEAEAYTKLVAAQPLMMPALAIDRNPSNFTAESFAAASSGELNTQTIADTGHYVAMEAPSALASAMLEFINKVDKTEIGEILQCGDGR
ncbi:pimeloyl-ACP methyl ester carboxylesterase [Devosia sp. UYZn731]|uniref:alpha/beta fold hydrolase n=1 Tax=Devosia sp. UYZn731 TaxID=3156345 RepID=UPI0033957CB4